MTQAIDFHAILPELILSGTIVLVLFVDAFLKKRSWFAMPIGLVGGVFSVIFGTGGPIYMVYLSARIRDKTTLRATSSVLVTLSVVVRTAVFLATGLLTSAPLLVAVAALLPFMFGGFWFGNRLHHALSRAGVLRLVAGLLVANGLLLALRALATLRGA